MKSQTQWKSCIKSEGWKGFCLSLEGNVCHLHCPFLRDNQGMWPAELGLILPVLGPVQTC